MTVKIYKPIKNIEMKVLTARFSRCATWMGALLSGIIGGFTPDGLEVGFNKGCILSSDAHPVIVMG